MNPKFITVSAKQGDPSILWVGESGRYYRTRAAAVKDNPAEAYPYKPPISTTVWVGVATLCVVAICIFMYLRKKK